MRLIEQPPRAKYIACHADRVSARRVTVTLSTARTPPKRHADHRCTEFPPRQISVPFSVMTTVAPPTLSCVGALMQGRVLLAHWVPAGSVHSGGASARAVATTTTRRGPSECRRRSVADIDRFLNRIPVYQRLWYRDLERLLCTSALPRRVARGLVDDSCPPPGLCSGSKLSRVDLYSGAETWARGHSQSRSPAPLFF
ncbi:hypothetical protein BC628DRAFT_683226 [Trametes gibbosa]|nr:hypothetical protein BC628DRAFT_683226 [Trametes gibbosa]